jgi:hypothetical protein
VVFLIIRIILYNWLRCIERFKNWICRYLTPIKWTTPGGL